MTYDTASTDPHTGGKLTFEMWVDKLEDHMRGWDDAWGNLPYKLPLSGSTGLDCWRVMYDDGLSPLDAFWEDQNAWL